MSKSCDHMRHAVILVGNKLIGLDSILPVAMELKRQQPDLQIIFLVLSARSMPTISRNYVLRTALERTGRVCILSQGDGSHISRIKASVLLARLALQMRMAPTLLMSASDFGRFPLNVLARAARGGGGRAVVYCKPAYPGNPALNYAHETKTTGKDVRFRDPGDAFVIYHPAQAADYAIYGMAEPILVGSPRLMPAWRQHLDRMTDEGIVDDDGSDLRKLPQPVLLVFYCGPAVIPAQIDNVRQSFLHLLNTLKEVTPTLSVVIKPHPICDLQLLRSDIAASGNPHIRVSHAHPQLLARLAVAAVSLNGSNVMNDMYVEGLPVLETTNYIDDILAFGPSIYPNVGRVPAETHAALEAALKAVAGSPDSLPRPEHAALALHADMDLADNLLGRLPS